MTTHDAHATIVPDTFGAREDISFQVKIRPGRQLAAGTTIECQFPNSLTNDRISPSYCKEWQSEDPGLKHFARVYVSGRSDAEMALEIRKREFVGGYDCPVRHGRCFVATVEKGEIPADAEIVYSFENTTAPWLANQKPGDTDHEGLIAIWIDGEELHPSPCFHVLPGPSCYERVIVPSSARPGKSFPIRLVSLDKYNNLSSSKFTDIDILLGKDAVAENLSYTGFCEITTTLPKEGIYRFTANGVTSNPIRITPNSRGPYWGDIHFHNYPSVDAMGNTPYEYARNVSCLDFAAATEHGAGGLPAHWTQNRKWCRDAYKPGHFVSLLGTEANVQWHLNVYHQDDSAPPIAAQTGGDSVVSPEEICEYLHRHDAMAQIHHSGWGYDMRKRYPDQTRLIEIYSMHGNSELYDPDSPLSLGNQRHRPKDDHQGPYYARDAWALGQRFVTQGSSDNHFGQPGVRYNSVTGARMESLDRPSLLEALKAGNCYATTGERILLDFNANARPMGTEFTARPDEAIRFGIEVHGTGELETVEVFRAFFIEGRNDVPVDELRFAEDDPEVEQALNSWETVFSGDATGKLDYEAEWEEIYTGRRSVYYARVRQKKAIRLPAPLEGQSVIQERPVCAWSSPIWITPTTIA